MNARLTIGAALAILLAAAPAAPAAQARRPAWRSCGGRTLCARAVVPLDYDHPRGRLISIAVARVPARDRAHRLGSLFFNFGGPGATAVDYLRSEGAAGLFRRLNRRFDIVGFDPRGVGKSRPAIDCRVDQEHQGIYAQPFTTPANLDAGALRRRSAAYVRRCVQRNRAILPHVSTANVARDMDRIRAAVDQRRLSYLGFSYGTLLGATYASMFPHRYRAMVLDGPVDATAYINRPWVDVAAQSAAFERALGRFFAACAADQAACSRFGGSDPRAAYDRLVARADAQPIPAPGAIGDPRPIDGDDIDFATAGELYAKKAWPELGHALATAARGDGTLFRLLTDAGYGRRLNGRYDASLDRYFTITAADQRYPHGVDFYLGLGRGAFAAFPHMYWNNGYDELDYGLWRERDRDAFRGPFRVPRSSPTPLVVATTFDPATPYEGALRLVHDLHNARLITMRGDGHTAYGGESPCIDSAVETYLNTLVLPAPGTKCHQDTGFAAPTAAALARNALVAAHNRRVLAGRVPGR